MSDDQDPTFDEGADEGSLLGDDPAYDPAYDGEYEPTSEPGRRRGSRRRRSVPGCIAVLVALAIIVGGFYFVVSWGMGALKDQFSSADDYPGPGHGRLSFQVHQGDSVAEIGRNLKSDGVVASVEAFTNAAADNQDSTKIQVGYYSLKKEMTASDVVDVLVDPSNLVKDTITFPEGLRLTDIVAILAKKTKYDASDFQKVLDNPDKLGLPSYANGSAEGYLFPATYDFGPTDTPTTMLQKMVARWQQAADDADLEKAASNLGYTPGELMTVASLVQSEGRGDDMPKISRVIYNRLENPDNGITNGKLQIDATVNYAAGNTLGAVPTTEDLQIDSPYNTYANQGLPPGPIEAPGDDAIAAAAHPADGDWLFYVTVNLKTGLTKFTSSYAEFQQFHDELRHYCETESAGAC